MLWPIVLWTECCRGSIPAADQPCGKDLETSSTQDTRVDSATASFCKMSRSYAAALCNGLDLPSSPLAAAFAKTLNLPMSTCTVGAIHVGRFVNSVSSPHQQRPGTDTQKQLPDTQSDTHFLKQVVLPRQMIPSSKGAVELAICL